MSSNPRIVIVIGIYRSGTSALTKGLEALGLTLTNLSTARSDEFNQKGYWEDLEVHQLNMNLFNALGPLEERQRDMLPFTEKETDFLCKKGYLAQGIALLQRKIRPHASLAFKDPKFSITLPFWKRVFEACGLTPAYVIALRHPKSVVDSMNACSLLFGIKDIEKLLWLWISFLLSALQQTQEAPRIIVNYEELLKNPSHQLRRVARAFKLPVDETLLKAYHNNFIDPSLMHFQAKDQQESFSFGEQFSQKIYQALLSIAQEKSSFCSLKPLFVEWMKVFSSVESLLIMAEKNEYTFQQLKMKLKERDDSIQDLNKIIREKLNTITQLCQTLHQRDLKLAAFIDGNRSEKY